MNVLDLDKIVPDKRDSFSQPMYEKITEVENSEVEKSPVGIVPRDIYEYQRGYEILAAMDRYASRRILIPVEWVHELQDIYARR